MEPTGVCSCTKLSLKPRINSSNSIILVQFLLFVPHVAYGEVEVQLHVFLTWALEVGEWYYSRSGPIAPGERAAGSSLVGWLSLKAYQRFAEERETS